MVTLLTGLITIIVIIFVLVFVAIYNALIVLRNNINKAWADIDVLLEKRHDQLGKLLDVVRGYTKYEKTIMTNITELRTSWISVQNGSSQAKMGTSNQISQALKSIFAVAENYPDLKANNSFVQLQNSINEIETQLADRREFYNDSVNQFNIRIKQIPYNFFAGMLGYQAMQMFQVPEEAKKDVKMDFGNI